MIGLPNAKKVINIKESTDCGSDIIEKLKPVLITVTVLLILKGESTQIMQFV